MSNPAAEPNETASVPATPVVETSAPASPEAPKVKPLKKIKINLYAIVEATDYQAALPMAQKIGAVLKQEAVTKSISDAVGFPVLELGYAQGLYEVSDLTGH